jgi:hypothetical protein
MFEEKTANALALLTKREPSLPEFVKHVHFSASRYVGQITNDGPKLLVYGTVLFQKALALSTHCSTTRL